MNFKPTFCEYPPKTNIFKSVERDLRRADLMQLFEYCKATSSIFFQKHLIPLFRLSVYVSLI